MNPRNWFRSVTTTHVSKPRQRCRPLVELLEDRAVPAAVAPPSGMVGWWAGENSGVDLIGGNNATLYNGAGYAAGEVAQSFSFDGVNDRAQVADTDALKLTASMTIEAWVKVNGLSTVDSGIILFRGDDRGGLDPYVLCVQPNGNLHFGITPITNQGTAIEASITLGQWTHVAATLDDATGAMKLYVNGVLSAQQTTSIRPFRDLDPASNPSIGIGNHGGYPSTPHNFPLNGQIDELSVYNRALSASEIQGIANAGPDGKIESPTYFIGDNPSIAEGNTGSTSVLTFTISRVGSTSGSATVNWNTANGTATAGADYVAASGQVVFQDGETQKTVQVTANGDDTPEANETINLVLSTTTPGYGVGGGQATILEDDVGVSISDASVTEDQGTVVPLGAFVDAGVGGMANPYAMIMGPDGKLYVSSINGNSVLRYDAITGAPLPAPGKSGAEFVSPGSGGLNLARDIAFGPDGALYVVSDGTDEVLRFDGTTGAPLGALVAAGAGGLDAPRGLTFQGGYVYVTSVGTETPTSGKDSVLRFDATTGAPAGVSGLPGNAVFIASGSGGLDNPSRLVFGPDGNAYVSSTSSTSNGVFRYDGSTGAYIDAFVPSGSGALDGPVAMVFRPDGYLYVTGWRSNSVNRYQASNGTFAGVVVPSGSGGLNNAFDLLFASSGELLVTSRATGQILRYGSPFVVRLNIPSATPVTVDYATADGTATAGSDYVATSGTLTFAPGETTKTILVQTLNDTVVEGTETFFINLSNSVGAPITDAQATGTIQEVPPIGKVFNDLNQNGVMDAGEPGLAGWTVFRDANKDGVLNPGEMFVTSGTDGYYQLPIPASGESYVALALSVGSGGRWVNTTATFTYFNPPTVTNTIRNFGVYFQPTVGLAPVGTETLVNATTAGQQGHSSYDSGLSSYDAGSPTSVSADAAGNYVVAWRTVTGGMDTINIRVFNADGSARTSDITVATFTNSSNSFDLPRVAMSGNGKFMVAWMSQDPSLGNSSVIVRAYNANGAPAGNAVTVLAASANQTGSLGGVAADAAGNYVVAYTVETKKGGWWSTPTIYAQRYTATGSANGSSIKVATLSLENGQQSVAMDGAGNFVVVWDDITSSSGVYAQRYKANGQKNGSTLTVTTDSVLAWQSNVAMNSTGAFAVTWDSRNTGQRTVKGFNADGTVSRAALAIAPILYGEDQTGVSLDGAGNLTFVWTDARQPGPAGTSYVYPGVGEAHMRRLTAANMLEPETIVNTTTQGTQFSPGVAATGNGKIVVVWEGNGPGDNQGIFSQRFAITTQINSFTASPTSVTAGTPVTLTANVQALNGNTITQVAFYVDSNGDGVLQPGVDTLLGYGIQTSPGVWKLTFSTTGWTSGARKIFAQAQDSDGVFGDPVALNLSVI